MYTKNAPPRAEGGQEQLCSLSRANQRPRICEVEISSDIVLSRQHRTWCWECWGWARLSVRSHAFLHLGHQVSVPGNFHFPRQFAGAHQLP